MNTIQNYIKAGYPGLYLQTHEEQRAESMLRGIAEDLKRNLFVWSCISNMVHVYDPDAGDVSAVDDTLSDPIDALKAIAAGSDGIPPKSIIVLEDFHRTLDGADAPLIRQLREALTSCNKEIDGVSQHKTIVILAPEVNIPVDVEKLLTVVEFTLPGREDLGVILDGFCASTNTPKPKPALRDQLLDAAAGMTTTEAEDAFALSVIEAGKLLPSVIQREKANVVKKSGLLEVVHSKVTLEDIGGLELLKEDLRATCKNFSKAAREFGLPSPRSKLFVGTPGTGKSLAAQAMRAIYDVLLLRLEAGNLFGSLVGESEKNWRTAFATARACAPCVLWIDEADGLFSAMGSAGGDGGTSLRVIKAIMQDMQFNSEGILFCFTANDIDKFPDALIDRMDAWGVDLPTLPEREAICRIQIAKMRPGQVKQRDPKKFDIAAFAKGTEGFSGRQIEQAWIKSLEFALQAGTEPTDAHIAAALKNFTPTSVTMAAQIIERRNRLQGKVKPASRAEEKKAPTMGGRKIAAQTPFKSVA